MAGASQGELRRRLEELVAPFLERRGFELVLLQFAGGPRRPVLRVFAERLEGGITLDDCVTLNQDLGALFDVEDPLPGPYTLEVSSPGLDRPLTKLDHFARYAGQTARLQWDDAAGVRHKATGTLGTLEGEEILVETPEGPLRVPFGQIVKAQLKYDFGTKSAGPAKGGRGRGRSRTSES